MFLVLLAGPGLRAEVFLTPDQALSEAFSGADRVDRVTLYLTEEQARRIEASARSKLESHVLTRHTAMRGGSVAGYAYFDTHVVRTMPETLLVVLTPEARVSQVLILAFAEPDDYRPRPRWLATLQERALDSELWPGRGVPKITGATLTAQAITDAVRRILAVHSVTLETSP